MSVTISVDQGIEAYMDYHRANSRPNTIRAFSFTLNKFLDLFTGTDVTEVPEADVTTFFNFVADTFNINLINPCSRGILKKRYKQPRHVTPELLDKEIVDEIIYKAEGRDRLMLEFMGRTAMRIGEVRQMRPRDLNIDVSTIAIDQPKSGRQGEVVYLPQKMMRRIDDYVRRHGKRLMKEYFR